MVTLPPPRYAVMGNPIAHSLSPLIHQQFAQQVGISVQYDKICAPLDGFANSVADFFAQGGKGLNITVPFKEQAYELAREHLGNNGRCATAINTLWMQDGQLHGDNTDGAGLLLDLHRLGHITPSQRILLLGAGGAAKGVLLPLMNSGCAHLHIANRNPRRAEQLATHAQSLAQNHGLDTIISSSGLDPIPGSWDLIINATSASLTGQSVALPNGLFNPQALAYDMMYGAQPTPFMRQAQAANVPNVADGLGMLVGQAAASFAIWHGLQVNTEPVINALRQQLLAT
ncbi:MAG: shikimate dehydrogenase [Burkholderiaceae bacterium]|nr:shikimate dehydrogenase [Burkholderiaceae bacterium]